MRLRSIVVVLGLGLSLLSAAAQAATNDWIDWRASADGAQHTYTLDGLTLQVSSEPGATADDGATPVLTVSAPGAAPVTLTGVQGYGDPAASIGVVQLDPASPKPQVLFLSYSGGAHCCTTMNVATLTAGGWRAFQLTYDGVPDKSLIDLKAGDGPPVLGIGDENFDYAFASHAASFVPRRYYAVRGGGLFDVTAEARFAAADRAMAAEALGYCKQPGHENGACATYVAEASLAGDHDAAWRNVLKLYSRSKAVPLPDGCRVDPGDDECPASDVIKFKTFPQALTWFLWRYGYDPAVQTFACGPTSCAVALPTTPAPR